MTTKDNLIKKQLSFGAALLMAARATKSKKAKRNKV